MTASDYIDQAVYAHREREMNLRNERRRIALDRQGVRPSAGPRGGLLRALRHRLATLGTHAPARG